MEYRNMKSHLGLRIIAGLIDYSFIILITYLVILCFGRPNDEGNVEITNFQLLIPMFFWGIMTIGTEQIFGATIGNGIVGLKPVRDNLSSKKITLFQSIKRHLADPVDMFLFGLPGIITISSSLKNQRIGDIWAKTMVVNEKFILRDNSVNAS